MRLRYLTALFLLSAALVLPQHHIARADDAKAAKPKPFTIVVVGDSLADGLWASLYRAYIKDRNVKVMRETLNSSGFTAYNWLAKLEIILRKYRKIDLVVAQMGTNDRQRLIIRRQRWPSFRSDGWIKGYRERVEKVHGPAARREDSHGLGRPADRPPEALGRGLPVHERDLQVRRGRQ